MEKIAELLDKLETLGELIPKLDTVAGWTQWLISLAVRVGPVCILVLGLIYLLIPPKEANRKAGYRTYFGMGSVEAWRFTQLVAGILMTVTGLVLTLIAYSAVKKFGGMDLMAMGEKAFELIKAQVICALVINILMFLITAVMFNRKGDRRFGKKTGNAPRKTVKKEAVEAPSEEQELLEEEFTTDDFSQDEYEKQGQHVLTAADIVIEDLE